MSNKVKPLGYAGLVFGLVLIFELIVVAAVKLSGAAGDIPIP